MNDIDISNAIKNEKMFVANLNNFNWTALSLNKIPFIFKEVENFSEKYNSKKFIL